MPPCIPPECELFDHPGFWRKLWAFAKRAGRPLIETCLLLYYTSQKDDLPLWAKLLNLQCTGLLYLAHRCHSGCVTDGAR